MHSGNFIMIIALLILISCNSKPSESVELEPAQISDEITISKSQFDGMKMQLGELSDQHFDKIIKATGIIEAENNAKAVVAVHFGGLVNELPWKTGEYVTKGQLLLTLISPEAVDLQQDYLNARAQLEYLKSEADRQELLAKENAVAAKQALKAVSEYKVMHSMLQSATQKLKLMRISVSALNEGQIVSDIPVYSPISGYISAINITKGSNLAPSENAMELVNTGNLHLALQVFEKDIMNVRKDQKIAFTIPVTGSKSYQASVSLTGKSISGEKRITVVLGHFQTKYPELLPGMFAEASIITEHLTLPALPEDAIIRNETQTWLYELISADEKNYVFKKIAIFTGETQNGFTAILNADSLNSDKKFLIKGAYDILTI
jgi:membrane fusion protein, heavy metal efflux system